MSDLRFLETRALYKLALLDFLQDKLPKKYIKDHQIPIAHLATVLLHIYKDRKAACKSYKEIKNPWLSTIFRRWVKTPELALNALVQGVFFYLGKGGAQGRSVEIPAYFHRV